jgi:hypothetical protein
LITACKDFNVGVFIFSKATLLKQGVLSHQSIGGKRGIRIYPPWDLTSNKQAHKTQAWQIDYFVELSNEGEIDLKKVKDLLA